MGWIVLLEDENKVEVSSLNNEFIIESFNTIINSIELKLVKYLDPYGDTVFNNFQMNDLINDLENIAKIEPENKLINEVILLAKCCLSQAHLYLVFYGD